MAAEIIAYQIDTRPVLKWRSVVGEGSVTPVAVQDQFLYAKEYRGKIVKVNRSNGTVEWDTGIFAHRGVGYTPVVGQNHVYTTTSKREIAATSIGDAKSAIIYESKAPPEQDIYPLQMAIAQRCLVVVDPLDDVCEVTCLSDDVSHNSIWRTYLMDYPSGLLATAHGYVIVRGPAEVVCLRQKDGSRVWARTLTQEGGTVQSNTPYVMDRVVYVVEGSRLLGLTLEDGTKVMEYSVPACDEEQLGIRSNIVAVGDALAFVETDYPKGQRFQIVKIRREDGEVLAQVPVATQSVSLASTLATDGKHVFVAAMPKLFLWKSTGELQEIPPPSD